MELTKEETKQTIETKSRRSVRDWALAVRPWSFPASVMPVIVTFCHLLWSGRDVSVWCALWAVVAVVLFHAAGNTWSDYYDFRRGVDSTDTNSVGTLTMGQFTPNEIYRLSLCLLAVAVAAGLGLAACTSWALLWVGIGGFLCSVCYPYLKYHALGDADIYLCYAMLPAVGTSIAVAGEVCCEALYSVLPMGLITVAILHTNNTRDMATDRRAGIVTLAMLLGKRASVMLYIAEVGVPFLLISLFALLGILPLTSLSVWLVAPIAWRNARAMYRFIGEGTEVIVNIDVQTAQLQMLFSTLLSVGMVAAWLWQ